MKRTLIITSAVVCSLALVYCASPFIWLLTGVAAHANSESAGVMYWGKTRLEAWGVSYSHGHQLQQDGTSKNFWKRPEFYHWRLNTVTETTNRWKGKK